MGGVYENQKLVVMVLYGDVFFGLWEFLQHMFMYFFPGHWSWRSITHPDVDGDVSPSSRKMDWFPMEMMPSAGLKPVFDSSMIIGEERSRECFFQ